jgi:flavin reductase (DIM6/NTAB) family NADH-FMN oxidoreductase RutF
MQIEVSKTPVVEVYQMLVGLVTPRPIAWVTTISPSGVINLAPFSFFNVFGANPPVVVFSPTLKRDCGKKDTLINIEKSGEFVINASTEENAEAINQSSSPLAYDDSEIEMLGLKTTDSALVRPPRLAGIPFALECKLMQIVPVGNGAISANLVIGEIVMIHVSDLVLGSDGQPDPSKLRTIARLGGDYWSRTSDIFKLQRPK